jgi:hypothetical protein
VFAYRRTPYLAFLFAVLIGAAVIWLVETPERPMTAAQQALFYALSYLPGLGVAMLLDPAPRRARLEYMKINFYAPKEPAGADALAARVVDAAPGAATQEGGTV